MKDKLIVVIVAAGLLAGCGRSTAQRNQHEYEVVQEGSASGVTATIHGPGETVPPITDTNVDTTTAFTLDPNAAATATTPAPGSIAGTLPPMPPPPPMTSAPITPSPITPAPRPVTPRPQPEPEPQPPPTQTEPAPEPPPTQTDTAPPTQTDTAPPPTKTETEEPPPPPPPPPL